MAEQSNIPGPSTSPKRKGQPLADLQGSAQFVPTMPTTGQEAAEAWGMSNADAQQTELKILRPVLGSRRTEILASAPLIHWRLDATAREFGPGTYIIKPGGGAFKTKQFTLEVSEEFARRAGWNHIEAPPPPSSVMGMQVAQRAQEAMGAGPLGIMLESIMKPLMDRLERIESRNTGGFDPMAMIALMQKMEEDGQKRMISQLDLLERLRGGKGIKAEETEPEEAGGMMTQLGKGVAMGLGELVMTFGKPSNSGQPQPMPVMIPGTAVPSATAQGVQPMTNPAPQAPAGWTAQEFQQVEPLALVLRDYLPKLKGGRLLSDAEGMADTLYEMLQPEAETPLVILAGKVDAMGPAALAVVDPSLADDYWAQVVRHLRDFILTPPSNDLNPAATG